MPRARLNLLPAVLAILLGAIVAIAAHGRTWSTHAGQSGWSARTFALVVIAGVALIALLFAKTVWRPRSSGITWPVAVATLAPVVLIVLALTLVALLWHRVSTPRCTPNCDRFLGSVGAGSAPSGAAGNNSGAGSPGKLIGLHSVHSNPHATSLLLVWLITGALVIGIGIWIWRRWPVARALAIRGRRRARHRQPDVAADASELTVDEADAAETTTRYIEASLDDLRNQPDLRRAIIACYAQMEQLFAHTGNPRERWETPFEFLRRSDEETGEPLDRLTRLYEEAQFSPHQIDEQRRAEAVTALTNLRNELGPATA